MTAQRDAFPFRRTSVWGGFRSNVIIPLRYGVQRGACVQYEDGNRDSVPRTRWVWSDGACAGIDDVYINGRIKAGGWTAANTVDTTGNPVMMITFVSPPPQDAIVSARGRGRIADGAMMQNPAIVLADIMAIAGITHSGLGVFQVETEKLGLRLSGQVPADDGLTVQDAIRSVCESIGARYSPRITLTAIVYPGGTPQLVGAAPYISAEIDVTHITGARCELDSIVNALSIEFGMRDGKASQVMDLEARTSIAAVGRRPGSLSAQWIGAEGQALDLANRILPYMARAPYVVSFEDVRASLRPGDWVRADGTKSCVPFCTGVHRVISATYDPLTELSGGTFEIWAAPVPTVTRVRTSSVTEDDKDVSTSQRIVGQNRQVTLTGANGRPLSNAKVVLDGSVTAYSDGGGVVTFALRDTPRGTHTLTITAQSSVTTDSQVVPTSDESETSVTVPGQTFSLPFTFTIEVFFE